MMTRRGLAGVAAGLALPRCARAFSVPVGQQISCRIMRKGSDIGRSTYTFDKQGDALTVGIAVNLRVKLGFIPLFHYAHTNAEHWSGDQLMHFESHTDNNGTPNFAAAHWNGTALAVTGSHTAPYIAPPRALASTYWNPRTLTDPLINSQDGKLLAIRLAKMGPSVALLSTGRTVAANEYRITGDLRANLWYDDGLNWAGMQYYAHDGSILTYERL